MQCNQIANRKIIYLITIISRGKIAPWTQNSSAQFNAMQFDAMRLINTRRDPIRFIIYQLFTVKNLLLIKYYCFDSTWSIIKYWNRNELYGKCQLIWTRYGWERLVALDVYSCPYVTIDRVSIVCLTYAYRWDYYWANRRR